MCVYESSHIMLLATILCPLAYSLVYWQWKTIAKVLICEHAVCSYNILLTYVNSKLLIFVNDRYDILSNIILLYIVWSFCCAQGTREIIL